jgi:hypothetical protein
MKTTLNKIREQEPCKDGWGKLLKHLGKTYADDVELDLLTILESNGLDDALWCLRAVDGHDKEKRLMAVAFAREVQHLMKDPRSITALDVAEKFAHGEATVDELCAAYASAASNAAAFAAYDARSAARAARAASYAAADAAYAAAYAAAAAADAAYNAAYNAAYASDADDAARYSTTEQNQIEIFKKFCS